MRLLFKDLDNLTIYFDTKTTTTAILGNGRCALSIFISSFAFFPHSLFVLSFFFFAFLLNITQVSDWRNVKEEGLRKIYGNVLFPNILSVAGFPPKETTLLAHTTHTHTAPYASKELEFHEILFGWSSLCIKRKCIRACMYYVHITANSKRFRIFRYTEMPKKKELKMKTGKKSLNLKEKLRLKWKCACVSVCAWLRR